ncbi:AraC family transcriptional regulator [Solirubrobacter sp. CPCC 204708]|uniref:Helix-turn-helix domain-containing protein n=1 Tax=Solirubrobacter deserti TaxID=2282478 RepID=A0ABT4RS57_9ACTN|nr:helix-turn-helix domain-containing protein [Solirubrobacter deserti]MBE2319866.1 AraC family transcriptional regulator [Solirubrobacter deserti]MDA0141399.1 helix-turn-helix domain-containing protein [Solirubrobacter deserti]
MTRVLRHVSELDRWEMVLGAPDPRLAPYILRYCDYDERTGSFVRRRELPGVRVVAIMNLGAPIRVRDAEGEWETHHDGFFAGLHDRYAITETSGAQRGVQIDLTPVGAHLLLRLPMHELTGRVVELDALLGADGPLLHEQLADARHFEQRFAALDAFFLARLDDAVSPVPSITRALTRLHATRGTVSIGTLTDELQCSRRHLNAGFKDHVGVSPKLLARILRFTRAVELSATTLSWAEISQVSGYYDQAHMVRDFQQFSGSPPTDFVRRRLPDGGGYRAD